MSRYNNDRNGTFQGILSMQIINIFGNRKRPKNRLLKIPAHLYVDSDFAGLMAVRRQNETGLNEVTNGICDAVGGLPDSLGE